MQSIIAAMLAATTPTATMLYTPTLHACSYGELTMLTGQFGIDSITSLITNVSNTSQVSSLPSQLISTAVPESDSYVGMEAPVEVVF